MNVRSPECRRSCLNGVASNGALGSATGAGCRRDAATRDAPAHLARHLLVIRSHRQSSAEQSAPSNIRGSAAAVNEMGIHICGHDTAAVLPGRENGEQIDFRASTTRLCTIRRH
jgi:hypothetical protein